MKKKSKQKKGQEEDELMFNCEYNGDFMKPFLPFYECKSLEPPLNAKQL